MSRWNIHVRIYTTRIFFKTVYIMDCVTCRKHIHYFTKFPVIWLKLDDDSINYDKRMTSIFTTQTCVMNICSAHNWKDLVGSWGWNEDCACIGLIYNPGNCKWLVLRINVCIPVLLCYRYLQSFIHTLNPLFLSSPLSGKRLLADKLTCDSTRSLAGTMLTSRLVVIFRGFFVINFLTQTYWSDVSIPIGWRQ